MPGSSAMIRETSRMTPHASLRTDSMGVGVIWDGIPFETPVIAVPPWREESSPSTAHFRRFAE